MSKRINIYLSDDKLVIKFNKEENKSGLITQLLTDYYNKDLDYLEGEKQALSEKIFINQSRIDHLLKIRKQTEELKIKQMEQEKELELNSKILNDIITLWKKDKISDKIYFSLFKNGKLIKQKALKILNEINI